jgi:defect-in-organelle-trafficking protein DotB
MSIPTASLLLPNEPIRFNSEEMKRMLLHATHLGASDITIQTGVPILVEIHGKLYPITMRALSGNEASDILNDIYGPNGTTQLSSGHDVDTHFEVRPTRQERYRYRVNGTACQVEGHDGIQITIRTIPAEPPDLINLKLDKAILDAMAPEQGTVVVTGSTGSGKSTLLAAIIKHLAQDPQGHRKILTYEAPIEFVYDSVIKPTSIVSQSEIPKHLPSFAAGVRNALRRKPRLILVGEARDPETIAAVIDAALTGHPVYTTLHSNGVADCVRRMISTFPAEERHGRALDILETLRLVIWQKLVPTVDGKRTALQEYLIFDEEVRDILVETPVDLLAAKTRLLLKERGQPMLKHAERKLEEGVIHERTFRMLAAGSKSADRDAGLDGTHTHG